MEKGDPSVCRGSRQGMGRLFHREKGRHEKGRNEDQKCGNFESIDVNDIVERLPDDPFGMEIYSGVMSLTACWIEDKKHDNFEPIDVNDIVKRLPDDPFGMDIYSSMMSLRACWIEDFGMDSAGLQNSDGPECQYSDAAMGTSSQSMQPSSKSGNCVEKPVLPISSGIGCSTFALDAKCELVESDGFGEIWTVNLHSEEQKDSCTAYFSQREGLIFLMGMTEDSPCNGKTGEDPNVDQLVTKEKEEEGGTDSASEQPHDGFLFALKYLDVQDLLSVERVCKLLHSELRNDPLLWRSIHIDRPHCFRLTDDALFGLTQRAQGILRSLDLSDCMRITDSGLKRVLESNPRIRELNVRGCVRLTATGLLDSLKRFKSPGTPALKHLKINGLNGLTLQHYEEMKLLLGVDRFQLPATRKPHFYGGLAFSSPDYEEAIDVEVCPKCGSLRLVYDCPAERCQGQTVEPCKGCILCIQRCVRCGKCIKDGEYEEDMYLDLICLPCWESSIIMFEGNREIEDGSNTNCCSASLIL